MSILGALTGSMAGKAAKQSGDMLSGAATKAGDMRSQAYLDAGNIQSGATLKGADLLSQGYLGGADYQVAGYNNANQLLNNGLNSASGYAQPYMNLGTQATGLLNDAYSSGALGTNYSQDKFQSDPSRMWRESQGLNGVSDSAAATGGLSPAIMRAMGQNNSNLADAEYGNAYSRFGNDQANLYGRLMGTSQLGQNSASNLAGLTSQNAANVANNQLGIGNALSNGGIGSAQALGNGMTGSAAYLADAGVNSADAKAQGLYDAANAYGAGLIGEANARGDGLQNVHHSIGKAIMSIFTMGGGAKMGSGKKSTPSATNAGSLNINTANDPYSQMGAQPWRSNYDTTI